MEILRDPEHGCPWDLQQSFASIVPYTLEEVYEVVDAIDRQDFSQLKDELGDLLLQIVYYAQMAREQNLFGFDDVAKNISDKLVSRHPHIFDGQADTKIATWEEIKLTERSKNSKHDSKSLLEDIPKAMPQLLRAKKIQMRVAAVGFDWQKINEVVLKVDEELAELKEAMLLPGKQSKIEEELGDLLFSVVNLSRHLKIDAEEALRKSNKKFVQRFQYLETKIALQGKELKDYSLDKMEKFWQEAKAKSG